METNRVREEGELLRLPALPENTILKIKTPVGESYYTKMEFPGSLQERIAKKKVPETVKNPLLVKRINTEEELISQPQKLPKAA